MHNIFISIIDMFVTLYINAITFPMRWLKVGKRWPQHCSARLSSAQLGSTRLRLFSRHITLDLYWRYCLPTTITIFSTRQRSPTVATDTYIRIRRLSNASLAMDVLRQRLCYLGSDEWFVVADRRNGCWQWVTSSVFDSHNGLHLTDNHWLRVSPKESTKWWFSQLNYD